MPKPWWWCSDAGLGERERYCLLRKKFLPTGVCPPAQYWSQPLAPDKLPNLAKIVYSQPEKPANISAMLRRRLSADHCTKMALHEVKLCLLGVSRELYRWRWLSLGELSSNAFLFEFVVCRIAAWGRLASWTGSFRTYSRNMKVWQWGEYWVKSLGQHSSHVQFGS